MEARDKVCSGLLSLYHEGSKVLIKSHIDYNYGSKGTNDTGSLYLLSLVSQGLYVTISISLTYLSSSRGAPLTLPMVIAKPQAVYLVQVLFHPE